LIRHRLTACRRYQQSPHRVTRHLSRTHVAPVYVARFTGTPNKKTRSACAVRAFSGVRLVTTAHSRCPDERVPRYSLRDTERGSKNPRVDPRLGRRSMARRSLIPCRASMSSRFVPLHLAKGPDYAHP